MRASDNRWLGEHTDCCIVRRFEEGGCRVGMPVGHKQWTCISGSRYQLHHSHVDKLCDLLFILNTDRVAADICCAEVKGGGMSVDHACAQLQAGADLLGSLLDKSLQYRFGAVLVHRKIVTVQLRKLRKAKVRFAGREYPIQLLRCGMAISNVHTG